MGDVLAVADWIRMRKAGNTQISIAKRIGCKRGKVEAAIRRGELDMANPQSIERWIYDKSKAATKPNPGLPFAHYSLVRNHHHAHRSNLKVSQRRRGRGSIEELLHGLQSLGFKSAQRRGTGHVHMKPDIFSISDAERLRDVMHANGWKAGQLSVSARRWLIVFGAVQVPASLRRLLRTHHRGGTAAS